MRLMYKNVMDGSAKRASVEGIFVGGKTGTANKLVGGHMTKKIVALHLWVLSH